MATRPARSLRHEYELYVEQEIENYKESVPRSVLLTIGDAAVSALADQQQLALTEMLLCEEVDRIIFRRLRLPSYDTWRRRRMRILSELRKPERWGFTPDDLLVRGVHPAAEARVLVAGASEDAALYLAANGCRVTAIDAHADAAERVVMAAQEVGLAERVHAEVADLTSWTPVERLSAVVVTPAALSGLSAAERRRVLAALQSATIDGGVHLVRLLAGSRPALSLDDLRTSYAGWEVEESPSEGGRLTFLARKAVA